jgi:hypothetical protein
MQCFEKKQLFYVEILTDILMTITPPRQAMIYSSISIPTDSSLI